MEIYNSRYLDSNKRFLLAVLAGLVAAVGLGLAYGVIYSALRVQSAVLYMFIGWCIGYVVRTVGRGVHLRFAVAGAVLTFISIFIGDMCAMFGFSALLKILTSFTFLNQALGVWLKMYLSTNLNSILGLLLRAAGIWFGFNYSRII
jgi:hypothetical protein